jgi:hypothetical protein
VPFVCTGVVTVGETTGLGLGRLVVEDGGTEDEDGTEDDEGGGGAVTVSVVSRYGPGSISGQSAATSWSPKGISAGRSNFILIEPSSWTGASVNSAPGSPLGRTRWILTVGLHA